MRSGFLLLLNIVLFACLVEADEFFTCLAADGNLIRTTNAVDCRVGTEKPCGGPVLSFFNRLIAIRTVKKGANSGMSSKCFAPTRGSMGSRAKHFLKKLARSGYVRVDRQSETVFAGIDIWGFNDPPEDEPVDSATFVSTRYDGFDEGFAFDPQDADYDELLDHFVDECVSNALSSDVDDPTLSIITVGEEETPSFEVYVACDPLEISGFGKHDPFTKDHLADIVLGYVSGFVSTTEMFSSIRLPGADSEENPFLLDSLSFDAVSSSGITSVQGKVGRAAFFDGGGRLEIAHRDQYLFSGGELSMMGWVKVNDGFTGPVQIFGKRGVDSSKGHVRIVLTGDGKFAFEVRGRHFPTSYSYNNGNWYHLAYVLDGSTETARIYLDGQGYTLSDWPFDVRNNDPFLIGGSLIESGFQGVIDEIKIYSRILSDDEILEIYETERYG